MKMLIQYASRILSRASINPGIQCARLCVQSVASDSEVLSPKFYHIPVMPHDIVNLLKPRDGHTFVDMTFGRGGHTKFLLDSGYKIRVFALDRDPSAYQEAKNIAQTLSMPGQEVIPLRGRFSDLPRLLDECNVQKGTINGVIMDLGASSIQMDDPDRGFSISNNGPLDMRMESERDDDPYQVTAADVINTLDSETLAKIFKTYGEDKNSRKIAQAIVDSRFMMRRLQTTHELAQLVSSATGKFSDETLFRTSSSSETDSLGRHRSPATKIFLALRTFINNEYNELAYGIKSIREYLVLERNIRELQQSDDAWKAAKEGRPLDEKATLLSNPDKLFQNNGKIAVLTFHSLEDRIAKENLWSVIMSTEAIGRGELEESGTEMLDHEVADNNQFRNRTKTHDLTTVKEVTLRKWWPMLKHVRRPSEAEILTNPRARSAKLRAAYRVL